MQNAQLSSGIRRLIGDPKEYKTAHLTLLLSGPSNKEIKVVGLHQGCILDRSSCSDDEEDAGDAWCSERERQDFEKSVHPGLKVQSSSWNAVATSLGLGFIRNRGY